MNWGRCDGSGEDSCSLLQLSAAQSLQVEALTRLRFQRWSWVYLDEGLWLAAVVYLDVDLGVRVALVSKAPEVAAVAQQVDGQAESQHA